jgi:lycopene cyclase domain-containing protein
MSFYLLLNILIISIPLFFSFEKNLKFYKNLPAVFISILTVSTFYILWDIAATYLGDWSFNKDYIGNIYVFNLPIEEIFFFITVPYSCIFIYETVRLYIKRKSIEFRKEFILAVIFLFTANSLYLLDNNTYLFHSFPNSKLSSYFSSCS